MILQEQCTARDVVKFFGAISFFGKFVRNLTTDAGIFELMIAGLSSMDLTRWHAFRCYLKILNHNDLVDTIHVHCIKKTTNGLLLPNLTELTICVPVDEISCLSRFMDYGVSCNSIYSCRNLCLLRLNLPNYLNFLPYSDEASYIHRFNRHVQLFKDWSNANSLEERYTQKYY
uniref:FBD domain-containing protein n=1 Tax=Syphacia muris TaxID=451379 RepID=A0A0N5AI24_9BILA